MAIKVILKAYVNFKMTTKASCVFDRLMRALFIFTNPKGS